jgi:2-polyprenyl-6-methoxyphenol hydroxylase-like FAD-dependent oxidoreductase
VALIERRQEVGEYRKVCTHFIQASARPILEELGLLEAIQEAGGRRSGLELRTRWGWIRPQETASGLSPYGLNIRRQKLDPMLRELAAETSGVTYMPGYSAEELLVADGRFSGLMAQNNRLKRKIRIPARLTVAADGHYSKVGDLSGVAVRKWPNNRFAYLAYFRDLPLSSGDNAQVWFMEPDVAYAFPTDDGLTLLTAGPLMEKLPSFKNDISGSFFHFWQKVPEGPKPDAARRVSEMRGIVKGHIVQRRPSLPGLAFVGDAALSSDPVWGVGLGWAFQSAGWLVDETTEALRGDGRLDRALARYSRLHRLSLASHHWHITGFATGRPFYPFEKLFFAAAARDEQMARHLHAYAARHIGFFKLASPVWTLRAIRAWLGR